MILGTPGQNLWQSESIKKRDGYWNKLKGSAFNSRFSTYSSSLCFILSHLLTVFYHQSSCCQYGSIMFLFSSEILKSRLHSTLYIKYVLHMQLVHKYKSKVKEYHIGVLSVQYSTYHTYYRSRTVPSNIRGP